MIDVERLTRSAMEAALARALVPDVFAEAFAENAQRVLDLFG